MHSPAYPPTRLPLPRFPLPDSPLSFLRLCILQGWAFHWLFLLCLFSGFTFCGDFVSAMALSERFDFDFDFNFEMICEIHEMGGVGWMGWMGEREREHENEHEYER